MTRPNAEVIFGEKGLSPNSAEVHRHDCSTPGCYAAIWCIERTPEMCEQRIAEATETECLVRKGKNAN